MSSSLTPDHKVACTFQEEDSAIYDMSGVNVAVHSAYNSTVPDSNKKRGTPTGLTVTTGADEATENKLDAYLLFQCDHMGSGLDYEFRWRKGGTSTWEKKVIADPGPEIGDPTFVGTGTLTIGLDGEFTSTTTTSYRVQIDGVGYPNTFKWSNDGGATWDATGVAMTGDLQTLENGLKIEFTAIIRGIQSITPSKTGGVLGDYWNFTVDAEADIKLKIGALPFNTKYFWCVRTVGKDDRKSAWAYPATSTITTWYPPVPSMAGYYPKVTTVKQGRKVIIDWSDWPDFGEYFVKKYKVMYKVGAAVDISKYTLFATCSNKESRCIALGLSPKVTYDFRVIPVGYTQDGHASDLDETLTDSNIVYVSSGSPTLS